MSVTHTPHAGSRPRSVPQPSRPANVGGLVINLVILYLVNVRPGWSDIPFLTEDTPLVLTLVNASLWASVALEAVSLVVHSAVLRAAGEAVTTAIALVATLRVWDVFPFDLADGWTLPVRILLVIAVVGCVIGIIADIGRLARGLTGPARDRG